MLSVPSSPHYFCLEALPLVGGALICRGVPPWAPLVLGRRAVEVNVATEGRPRRDAPTN